VTRSARRASEIRGSEVRNHSDFWLLISDFRAQGALRDRLIQFRSCAHLRGGYVIGPQSGARGRMGLPQASLPRECRENRRRFVFLPFFTFDLGGAA